MIKLGFAHSQREDKTIYAAARVGDVALFAAIRYDLRRLLHCLCAGLAVWTLLRRTLCCG